MGFWNNVLEECEYRGISRKELAQEANFSVHTISNGLKRDGMPAADIALRISKFLEIPLEKLLDETTKKPNNNQTNDTYAKQSLFDKYYPLIQQLEKLPKETSQAVSVILRELSTCNKTVK